MLIAAFIGVGTLFGVRAQTFTPPAQPQTSFLACMQAAEARKEQAGVQLYAWMYQQKTIARQRQAELRIAAWNIADDRERRRVQREIDRAYRDALRAIDNQFDDVADVVMDRYRDERRACDRLDDDDGRSSSSRSSSSFSQWWEPFSSSSASFGSFSSSSSGFFVPGVIGGGIGTPFP